MKENKHLEYKQEINDKFLKTVSAFANYEGGDIVFGISDVGEKIGLKELDKKCLAIENMINDSIKPKPEFTISINKKDETITLHVHAGSHTPYYYKTKTYIRNDTSTVEVDDIELKRLILNGEHLNYEDIKSDNQNLTFSYLEKRLKDALGIEKINKDVLKTLNLYSDKEGYNYLSLPPNMSLLATMNTSDQSLFPIDSAFKRRWDWKYIKIKEGKDENGNKLDWKVDVKMDEAGTLLSWWDFIKKINKIIASMTSSADKQLGYFFCCAKDGVIDEETFVSKVIFYLWNDVFKDYGFEDASLFRYTTKDEDGKDAEKDLTFPDFYDEEGEKVNTERLTDFVKKVMSWKADNKKDED